MSKTERDGKQTGTDRRQLVLVRIGAANDQGEFPQGRICETVFLEERIKAAKFGVVRQLNAWNVIGNCIGFFRNPDDILFWDIEKFGILVDEALNQPRASDSIDLRAFTSNPFHALPR